MAAAVHPYHTLNHEQQAAFDFLLRGDNVALLGPAGVGKSYLLSVIDSEFPGMLRRLELARGAERVKLPRIQMCALTGCAALLLGHKAKTLHSWAGIGLGKGTVQELYVKIRRNRKVLQHWLLTDLLVIDEVSMLTAELLDKLNELGKKIRGSRSAFGGLQVLLVGDFFQLPPVNRSDEPVRFAFESNAWKRGNSNLYRAHTNSTTKRGRVPNHYERSAYGSIIHGIMCNAKRTRGARLAPKQN